MVVVGGWTVSYSENSCCILYAIIVYLQEEERKKKQDMEMGGWTDTLAETEGAVESPPIQQTDMKYPTAQADAEVAVNKV
jgi:hypothetical protein